MRPKRDLILIGQKDEKMTIYVDTKTHDLLNKEWPECPNPKEDKLGFCRWVVKHHSATKDSDGVLIDVQSANVVLQIHKNLNDKNRAKFEAMATVGVMAELAWELVK